MKKINLSQYGPIISDKAIGQQILSEIKSHLPNNEKIEIDLSGIKSMATFCAKQIFGNLYIEMGSNVFFDKIIFINTSDDVKLIIKIGIQNAIDEK